VDRLYTTIRPYAWGSRTALAEMQGRPSPSDGPEAELWAGAHPGAPSRVVRDGRMVDLGTVLAADPAGELGPAVVAEFGAHLPYLLKVLAVAEPLSLQAHPDAEQARAGFAAEEAAGVPRDGGTRTYRDPSAKPELVCALTPFEALCGFREVDGTVRLLDHLQNTWGVAPLVPYVDRLRAGGAGALRDVVAALLRLGGPARERLVAAVGEACAGAAEKPGDARLVGAAPGPGAAPVPGSGPGPRCGPGTGDGLGDVRAEPGTGTYGRIADLAERHPGDPGVVVALLLNHVVLEPGEAIFVPAGSLHAYLRGVGVEVMANSDNVLRGGLTPKHIDTDALLGVLRFDAGPVHPVRRVAEGGGLQRWAAPAREFSLCRVAVDGTVEVDGGVPQILLCVEGEVRATAGGAEVVLTGGVAAFVSASDPAVTLSGRGVVFRACPGVQNLDTAVISSTG
jgi:mannose-6-phosphate isomerase